MLRYYAIALLCPAPLLFCFSLIIAADRAISADCRLLRQFFLSLIHIDYDAA